MTTILTLVVNRSELLTANLRLHRMEHARRTKILRYAGRMVAHNQKATPMDRAHITVHVEWPDKRRRDVHNVMPTVKAHVDGFVDAGLLPDDDDKHLIGPDLRVGDTPGHVGVVRFIYVIEEVA